MTALTNRALMEIADKHALDEALRDGLVCKTNVTADECAENPNLMPIKQLTSMPGTLSLCLFVGDTRQLPPIVSLNDDIIAAKQYCSLVNGLAFMAKSNGISVYQLTKTYRFGKRSASYTGVFYNDTLDSLVATPIVSTIPSLQRILNANGGPTLVMTDMELGTTAPDFD